MSKADNMLLNLGFKMVEKAGDMDGAMRIRYEDEAGGRITFGHSIKTLSISYPYISIELWRAINEKITELGWLYEL